MAGVMGLGLLSVNAAPARDGSVMQHLLPEYQCGRPAVQEQPGDRDVR